jgi:GNAT superfamily N-acetyltransferase
MSSNIELEIIPFAEWRQGIAPLWLMQGSYTKVHPTLNGHGQMQYIGRELFERILLFPVTASHGGRRIGWTSIYNISDSALRIRGVYVAPEFRSNGVGRAMVEYAIGLWPSEWSDCFMYARASNIQRYERWGFEVVRSFRLRSFEDGEMFNETGVQLMKKTRSRNKSESR